MLRGNWLRVLCASFFIMCAAGVPIVSAQEKDREQIHVDIPVKLEKANVVFNLSHPVFVGDMPLGMRYMDLLADRFKQEGTNGNIIGVFYGDATYMVLNDKAYDSFRKVSTGNPYKQVIANLLEKGVRLEVCAVAMKMHQWSNGDLLPGIKVNSGGIIRIVQLVQQGYTQVEP